MAGCKVIGLYGGAGSGKSEAARILHEHHGAYIIKADDIGHRLYRIKRQGYNAVVRICGRKVLNQDEKVNPEINLKTLSEMLFNDPEMRKKVNAAIHPMVYAKAADMIKTYKTKHSHGLIIFEAALIPERKLCFINENWYIHSDINVRMERLKETRNYSDAKILAILGSQPSDDEYKAHCEVIIENNHNIKELEDNIDEALKHCQRQ